MQRQVGEVSSKMVKQYNELREYIGNVIQKHEATYNLRLACIACAHYIRSKPSSQPPPQQQQQQQQQKEQQQKEQQQKEQEQVKSN